uniref:Delta-like protein n=1 Tax=Anopheles atroparvus TaxID=41427 RepID=A0AAG5DH66_ANOAO
MNWIYILAYVYISSHFLLLEVAGSGLFELELRYFQNEKSIDHNEKCCSGKADELGRCIGTCKTRFRACLKHYQATIDTTSPCTFGDVITPVLEGTTLNFTAIAGTTEGFANPLRFPFEFGWPGYFTLIIEAWHDTNETTTRSPGTLISRLSIQRILEVSADWMEDSYNSSHTMIRYAFRVTCDPNYYGAGCANLCRKRDDQFGHYTCSPTGERVCLSGWQGEYCTFARCTPGCTHGHCNKPNECICQSGWKGPLCDECEPYPGCVYGTCKKPWECICKEGWGGLFCNQDLNFCTNHKPCQNGGTCFNTGQGSYTCQCRPGYTGTECESSITSCIDKPCLHGATCHELPADDASGPDPPQDEVADEDEDRKYRCHCTSGWMGTHCEREAITCAEKPCHHGTCIDTPPNGAGGPSSSSSSSSSSSFRCECPVGYSGTSCEIKSGECYANFCANGGTCHVAGSSSSASALTALLSQASGNDAGGSGMLMCLCPDGFVGDRCEENVDDCVGNPCLNGGTCLDADNHFKCQCVPGFIGTHCEEKVDLCLTKPCANGGTCTNLNNDYRCQCRAGFAGKDCSADVDECAPAPCRNGGTCINRVNSFQCVCAGGFRGPTCEQESASSSTAVQRAAVVGGVGGDVQHHHHHPQQQLRHAIAGGDLAGGVGVRRNADGLSSGQIVLIAILSISTPLAAFIAAAIVICLKRKRQREQEKDDAEARKQNEQNASHNLSATHHHHHLQQQQQQHHQQSSSTSPSSAQGASQHPSSQQQLQQQQQQQQQYHGFHNHHLSSGQKRNSSNTLSNFDSSHHMIKNTWDKSINNMPPPPTIASISATAASSGGVGCNGNAGLSGGAGSGGVAAASSSLLGSGGGGLDDSSCLMSTTTGAGGVSSSGGLLYLSAAEDSSLAVCSTLQRAKSQKQLNTDPSLLQQHHNHHNTLLSQSASLHPSTGNGSSGSSCAVGATVPSSVVAATAGGSTSMVQPGVGAGSSGKDLYDKRISVLSESGRLCHPRWNASPVVVAGSHSIVGPCSPPHI